MRADSGIPQMPITALAANGPLVFAGTDSGVYRSTDDGISWARTAKIDTTYQGCQISAIASSGKLLFAATYLNKIFRSTDSGITWTSSFDLNDTELLENSGISTLRIIGSIILAGTFEDDFATDQSPGCIWRSNDTGNTWSRSANGIFHPFETTDIGWSAPNLYATCLNSGLYRSTDTGASWIVVDTTGDFQYSDNDVAALGSVLAVVRNHHALMRSNDTGHTWTSGTGLESLQVWALEIQDSTIFAGTDGGVFRSYDSGATWVEADSGMIASDVDAFAVDSSGIYAAAYGGGVYRFKDTTSTWDGVGNRLRNTYVSCVAKLGDEILTGTVGSGLWKINIDSTHWDSLSGLKCDLQNVYALAVDTATIFSGTPCGVEQSTDSGLTWNVIDSANDGRSLFVKGNTLIAGSSASSIDISTDGGIYWADTQFLEYIPTEVTSSTMNTRGIFAAMGGGVIRSTDLGTTWDDVNNGLAEYVGSLASDGATVFAGESPLGSGPGFGVFLSTDNGNDWVQENTGLNDLQIESLAIRGDTLFAGTRSGGVYWTDISSLPSGVTPEHSSIANLSSPWPNPFESKTSFHFDLSSPQSVTIIVSDQLGREVWRESRFLPAGAQNVEFDGRTLPQGEYFYQIRREDGTVNGSMVIER